MLHLPRHRNLEQATGQPYDKAFSKTELHGRGWTSSMIRRHLGAPNAVVGSGFAKYQYDARTVYKTEATVRFQLDLLALEDVRWLGLNRLGSYRCYIPAMMRAALKVKAEKADDPEEAEVFLETAENLPEPFPKCGIILPPPPPPPGRYQQATN